EHPDKGGDVEKFGRINTAYTFLTAAQTYTDERAASRGVFFEATVTKQGGKTGLGLVLSEDKVRQRLLVVRVTDDIEVVIEQGGHMGVGEGEAEGEQGGQGQGQGEEGYRGGPITEILAGDRLVGVDSDECAHWHFSRVKARLNHFRIPVDAAAGAGEGAGTGSRRSHYQCPGTDTGTGGTGA
ncbi:hypothetical protein B484DRAFT_392669, partial [Ochromonadaceae sp. CCMP2298]